MFIEKLSLDDIVPFLIDKFGQNGEYLSGPEYLKYTNTNGLIQFTTLYNKYRISDFAFLVYNKGCQQERCVDFNKDWRNYMLTLFGNEYATAFHKHREAHKKEAISNYLQQYDEETRLIQ